MLKSDLGQVYRQVSTTGRGIVMFEVTIHNIFQATYAPMYRYLPISKDSAVKVVEHSANAIFIRRSKQVWNFSSFQQILPNIFFLPARRYASAVFPTATCLSVRPSVCLSVCHTPVLCLAGSWYAHHDSSLWQGMSRRKIRKGSPQRNVPAEGGVGFFGDFRPICRHISKTVHLDTKLL